MFGSKLRSWMENHIVRPRKKGNKNKTGNSGTNFGVLTTQNGYKSGSFAGDSTIGSPARRSEVSPIQNHTTSRRGWHSPNQDSVPISPKSDHFPIQHRVAANGQPNGGGAQYWMNTYGAANGAGHSSHHQSQQQQQQHHQDAFSSPKSISRNGSSYALEPGSNGANVYYSKSVDSFADGVMPYGMPEFDFRTERSSPGPSSVMTGTGSVSTHGHHINSSATTTGSHHGHYSTATSSSNEQLLEDLHTVDAGSNHHRIKRLHPAAARISSSSSSSVSSSHHNANNNFGPAGTTTAATPSSNNNNNHMLNGTLLSQYGTSANGHHHQQQALSRQPFPPPPTHSAPSGTNGECKYGKLVHSTPKQYGPPPAYYDQQQPQQIQHNGINNNPLYSPANGGVVVGAKGVPVTQQHQPGSACTSPLPRGAAAASGGIRTNRIINGNNNNNNNNNNNVHFDVPQGKGSPAGGGGGSSLSATFASKFHKLTGSRSEGGSKLNHVNNNSPGAATPSHAPGHSPHGPPASNNPYHQHQYQINNVTTHLHPPGQPVLPPGKHHHHHQHQAPPSAPLLPAAPSSSSSSSSPPPPQPGTTVAHPYLHHPSATHGPHHHHHPHGAAHPMGHTLSSPESAYSTGYSTDGTSPGGCSYTPEYYINIRTGTHYFPKGTTLPGRGSTAVLERTAAAAAAAAGTGSTHENGAKFKCALNRIEEKHVEFCVDSEKHVPAPRSNNAPVAASTTTTTTTTATTTAAAAPATTTTNLSSFKPASAGGGGGAGACVLSQPQQPSVAGQAAAPSQPGNPVPQSQANGQPPPAVAMSPIMQKNLGMQHYRSIESPSPRQRCRIRTNPWLTTADGVLASNCLKRTEQDSGSTSSGIKSSSGTDDNKHDNMKPNALSDTDSSSSTEKVVNKKMLTPRSLKKGCDISRLDSKSVAITFGSNLDSDEDATLNEMMGKFDESYHYEKETDILSCSDSDPTDCPTDIDTGQDAGDECDTDDLLDLDFIDTGSVQEVPDKEIYRHTASCSIHQFPERIPSCKQRSQRNKRSNENGGGSRRRKKLVRTRKKPADCPTSGSIGVGGDCAAVDGRGCRSLGGTPVSLRRNQQDAESRTPAKSSPLTNRCNSLTFTEVHSLHSRILAISESEKALLRADLEADVKYKQLICEAESILFSMKSNSSICIKELTGGPPPLPPRDPQPPPPPPPSKDATNTTIASPRRVCNPPANKRVEMLRNCEADLRRELAKTCSQKTCADGAGHPAELNPAEGVIVNKRLEVLRYETSCSVSAPNSPKNTRVLLPRKTHVSNFMHHQARPAREPCTPESLANDLKQCANLSSPAPPPPPPRLVSKSPTIMRRRFRSQSPHLNIESDSDSDDVSRNLDCKTSNGKMHRNGTGNKENHVRPTAVVRIPPPPPPRRDIAGKQMNNFRHTIHGPAGGTGNGEDAEDDGPPLVNGHGGMHKSPLISFRSVDIGSPVADDSYCPQSEPLKRKIYTCSAAFEKIQRSLDQDPELSKKALLERISLLRRERRSPAKTRPTTTAAPPLHDFPYNGKAPNGSNGSEADATKQQLIMDTLAEIKRSLEDQSVELNELNDSDN